MHTWGSLAHVVACASAAVQKVIAAEMEEHQEDGATTNAFLEQVCRYDFEQLADPDEEAAEALEGDFLDSSTVAAVAVPAIVLDHDLLLALFCGLARGA